MDVRIENCESLRVAFARHVGPYEQCGAAWEKLLAFATKQGWDLSNALRIGIGHDNPDVTPAEKLRYDACLTVDDKVQAVGEIGVQELPGGEYAVVTHRGPYPELPNTWRAIFRDWAPHSGRELRPSPCFEIYTNDPSVTPPEDLVTKIHIPLKR